MEEKNKETTTLGLEENIEGALCYSHGLITGILFLLVEKDSQFVRFHAIQSTSVFFPLFLIQIFTFFSFTYKAFKGEMYKLPLFGNFSERLVGNLSV